MSHNVVGGYERVFLNAFNNPNANKFTQTSMGEHYVQAILYHHPQANVFDQRSIATKVNLLLDTIFLELKKVKTKEELHTKLIELGRNHEGRLYVWFKEFDQAYDHYKKHTKLPFHRMSQALFVLNPNNNS